jgi:hypothetical protein
VAKSRSHSNSELIAPWDVVAPLLQVQAPSAIGQAGYFPIVSSPALATARPIFVVGSPRSGTSILTWCLGQHSNIFVQEESDWIGPFAYQIDIAYRMGSARGERSQLSALGIRREEFFAHFGQSITNLILDHRQSLEARLTAQHELGSLAVAKPAPTYAFQIARSESDSKARWVDGTPEYSLYIPPLRTLFPEARFVHITRNVTSVVHSILNFERTGGPALVSTEQQAYEYWLRTVRACLQAERAYGSEIVCRIRHSDLISHPEATIRRLLAFLDEPFEPSCLEPLRERINSSGVPANFNPSDPGTNPAVIDEANRLNQEVMMAPMNITPDPAAAAHLEGSFNERSIYLANLGSDHARSLERIAKLQKKLDDVKAHGTGQELVPPREQQ